MTRLHRACGGLQGDGLGIPLPDLIDSLCSTVEFKQDNVMLACRLPRGHDGDCKLSEVQE